MSELYKCPICKVTAEIDKEKKQVTLHLLPPQLPKEFQPRTLPPTFRFPSHVDCELGKAVDMIDLKKLVKVEPVKT